jgi:hypothetical protein
MALTTEVESLLTTISNVYLGNLPDSPDNAVAINPTGGFARDLFFGTDSDLREPTFQIIVRNLVYATGEALCETILGLLSGKTTTNIKMIQQMSDVISLGRDQNNRPNWSINFRCYLV